MRTEDWYIIYRCLSGDSAAFGLLVDKYRKNVYTLAYSILRNSHDAEDVTQEVFIKAYEKLFTLRKWDSFPEWLYATTSNSCKNWMRSRSRRPDRDYVEEHPKVLRTRSMDSHRLDLVCESLYQALNALPEMHRQVLALHYLGGMSVREIARLSGTLPNTIKQRLRRARLRLRAKMLATMNAVYEEDRLPDDTSHCDIATYEEGVMKTTATLCMLLAAMPGLAGTFSDDFEDGNLDGWTEFGDAKWEIVNGKCKFTAMGDPLVLLMTGEPGWSDYSLEVDFQPNQPTMWIGLGVRVQNPQNSYIWAVDCTDKTVHWITNIDNQLNIITGNPVAVGLENHSLKVVAKGGEFQGYYDEKPIRAVQLGHFKSGKVAMLIRSWSPPGSALFDNIVITGDDVPDTGPSGFAVTSQDKLTTTWGRMKESD